MTTPRGYQVQQLNHYEKKNMWGITAKAGGTGQSAIVRNLEYGWQFFNSSFFSKFWQYPCFKKLLWKMEYIFLISN